MLSTGAVAPSVRATTLMTPVRGAASSDQATAPISGGVMNGISAAISITPLSGVLVRAMIHTSGSASTKASGTVPATSNSVFVIARGETGQLPELESAATKPWSP